MIKPLEMENKKTLILTGLSKNIDQFFPIITDRLPEEIIITRSFGTEISHPFGCTIRNIIMSIYFYNIEEIYIIGEKDNKEYSVSQDQLFEKLRQSGVSKETINHIDYIGAAGSSFINWLEGIEDPKQVIRENIGIIKDHPIISNNISVYGFIIDGRTGVFEKV